MTGEGALFESFNFEDSIEVETTSQYEGSENNPLEAPTGMNENRTSNGGVKSPINDDAQLQEELKDLIEIDDNINDEELESNKASRTAEKKIDVNKPQPQGNTETDSSSPYKLFAKHLHDEGLLTSFTEDRDVEDISSLTELFENELDNRIDNYINSLPDKKRQLVEAALDPDVTEETLIKMLQNTAKTVDMLHITEDKLESDEALQRQVYAEALRLKGFDEDEISEAVEDADNLGKLRDKALAGHKFVVKHKEEENKRLMENDRQMKMRMEQERAANLNALKEKVMATQEVIPGIPLTKQLQERIFQSMTTPVGKTESGQPINEIGMARSQDPIGFDTKVNYIFQITKGFKDFSKLMDSAKSQAVKDFDKIVKSNTSFKTGSLPNNKSNKETDSLFASLRQFTNK